MPQNILSCRAISFYLISPLHCFLSVFVSRRRYEGINGSLEFFTGVSCSRYGVPFLFPEFVSIVSATYWSSLIK